MNKTVKKSKTTPATKKKSTPKAVKKVVARTPVKKVAVKKVIAKKTAKVIPLFKKQEVERFREALLEEKERLSLELEEIEARAARALESEAAGEFADHDDLPADALSETFEREKDLAIADNIASLLVKINNALGKIEKSTYGVCDICRKPIKRARLEAIPFATLCIDCQGRVEVG